MNSAISIAIGVALSVAAFVIVTRRSNQQFLLASRHTPVNFHPYRAHPMSQPPSNIAGMDQSPFLARLLAVPATLSPRALRPRPRLSYRVLALQWVPIARFQLHAGERMWRYLKVGHYLDLYRDRTNPYDGQAIRVCRFSTMLGYVPREENAPIARLMDQGHWAWARIARLTESDNPRERVLLNIAVEIPEWGGPMHPALAKRLAMEGILRGLRESIDLVPVNALPGTAYGFNPEGWLLFAVVERHPVRTGGSEFVAVHPDTGEVRRLGVLGE